MMTIGSRAFALIVMLVAAAVLAGCTTSGIPQDGRYQTHGTGWDNWRG
jgi:predicted small secreted protein